MTDFYRAKFTLIASVQEIPEAYEDFKGWAENNGFHVYGENNFTRAVTPCGVEIYVKDKYFLNLEDGGYVPLTAEEATERNMEKISDGN